MNSRGVRQALAYAFDGTCDSHLRASSGVVALAAYGEAEARSVSRFVVEDASLTSDELTAGQLEAWVDGRDPVTGERRGRVLSSPDADLVLDGTINAPKSFSVAALIHPELAAEFEALQDRLRDRIIRSWAAELNARRGAGGRIPEQLSRIEVVELQHRRSRALDPHVHRHLWLNVKVRGVDGAWSNVDSRVAMRFHTVVNAEGELAARTDPAWIAALARHGYSLGDDGEIAELAHVVKPLSRRSNQIEANRAVLLHEWRAAHPGETPSADVLRSLDRQAWAAGRPDKPKRVDEGEWEQLVREELQALDPTIFEPRRPSQPVRDVAGEPDVGLLAGRAVIDADQRSTSHGGRFSMFDLRAGAMRAIAASGQASEREQLQPLIGQVMAAALEDVDDLLGGGAERPAQVKAFMATSTVRLKQQLTIALDLLAKPGVVAPRAAVAQLAGRVLGSGMVLGERQLDAASAIAGTDPLVSVTGPAGSGKTSMLRVAHAALTAQRRSMIVVAPTKKAASVSAREIGSDAASLHALLHDHGWRWNTNPAGAQVWTRLEPGDAEADQSGIYTGVRRYPLRAGDRIVVDEAGMVDLHAANALTDLAARTGASIAMVGDPHQAMPVGHSGAMAMLTRRAAAVVELDSIHRFSDPTYAALTLRMRATASHEDALDIAAELDDRDHLHRAENQHDAQVAMVDAYLERTTKGQRVALVTATNDEAAAINEAIQQRRVELGELSPARIAVGRDEQRILEGDIVQTRRNDRAAGVENRAHWIVTRITAEGIDLASAADARDLRTVSHQYAAEAVHLAYASTVHGIQGETTDAAIVGPGVDAAGLYVGMTRGRHHNHAVVVAHTDSAAREQLANSMQRGLLEAELDDSIRAARNDNARAAHTSNPDAEIELARAAAVRATSDAVQRGAHHAAVPRADRGIEDLEAEWRRSTESPSATRPAQQQTRPLATDAPRPVPVPLLGTGMLRL